MSGPSLAKGVKDLSLRSKITLILGAVFAASMALSVAVSAPLLGQQRQRLLEQDKRLIGTLRHTYEREFIYDILSASEESLAGHLGDLASQEGVVLVRVTGGELDLSASADTETLARLLGQDFGKVADAPGRVLVMRGDGRARVVGAGGRPLIENISLAVENPPAPGVGAPDAFSERHWQENPVLHLKAELSAAGEHFGTLQLLYSLAPLERSDRLARALFYGTLVVTFLVAVVLLNLVLSRIVIAPIREVMEGMSLAQKGDLGVRLGVRARDEIGTVASAFNRMLEQLASSRSDVEAQSRELEARVAQRTSELRASEARLLKVKNHLATVIRSVGTGVIAIDETGIVETFNDRAGEILGIDPELSMGRPIEQVLRKDAEESRRILDFVGSVREGLEVRREAQVVVRRDEGRRTISFVVSALPGEGGGRPGAVVVCEDLTRLIATQRLEAWKEAVERVIHEIKNPLTPVGLAAQTLKTAHDRDPVRFEALFPSAVDMILRAVQDLKELINEFSRFSRLPEMRTSPHDPNALVLSAVGAYVQAPPEGVTVRTELAPGLPEIEVDVDQVRRVLLNVVNNAVDAMEGRGGQLVLRTGADEGGVVISVEDEGQGVEDVERIFEPHYTTKVKGTGLGLAIARQIVEEHGGRIRVHSTIGRGTTVRIHLPTGPGAVPRRTAALAGESGDSIPIMR